MKGYSTPLLISTLVGILWHTVKLFIMPKNTKTAPLLQRNNEATLSHETATKAPTVSNTKALPNSLYDVSKFVHKDWYEHDFDVSSYINSLHVNTFKNLFLKPLNGESIEIISTNEAIIEYSKELTYFHIDVANYYEKFSSTYPYIPFAKKFISYFVFTINCFHNINEYENIISTKTRVLAIRSLFDTLYNYETSFKNIYDDLVKHLNTKTKIITELKQAKGDPDNLQYLAPLQRLLQFVKYLYNDYCYTNNLNNPHN